MKILEIYKDNITEINITIRNIYDMARTGISNYINNINCKIALLHNLSIIYMHDKMDIVSNWDIYNNSPNLYYIYEDKMSFFIYKSNDTIKPSIKYLNITNINKDNLHLLNNLPLNIEYLHISSYENYYDNLNFPINLKQIKITLINNEFNDFNIKLPFGCELVTNKIIY